MYLFYFSKLITGSFGLILYIIFSFYTITLISNIFDNIYHQSLIFKNYLELVNFDSLQSLSKYTFKKLGVVRKMGVLFLSPSGCRCEEANVQLICILKYFKSLYIFTIFLNPLVTTLKPPYSSCFESIRRISALMNALLQEDNIML